MTIQKFENACTFLWAAIIYYIEETNIFFPLEESMKDD
jgi:hypothetical protein